MNAPEIKQIISVDTAKKSPPNALAICVINLAAFSESTIAAQMLKPINDAPTKMNIALLLAVVGEGVNLI